MVVELLIAESQAVDPLANQLCELMLNAVRVAKVAEAFRNSVVDRGCSLYLP
jgi:hypothetical protein